MISHRAEAFSSSRGREESTPQFVQYTGVVDADPAMFTGVTGGTGTFTGSVVVTLAPPSTTVVPASLTLPSATITVASTTAFSAFPSSGTLLISGPGDTLQAVTYSGVDPSTFTFLPG